MDPYSDQNRLLPVRAYDYPAFKKHPNLGLAITQIVMGTLCVFFNTIGLIMITTLGRVAIGIWGGIPMIVAGSFGTAAAVNRGKCLVVTTLVMSIISGVLSLGIFVIFIIAAINDSNDYSYYPYYNYDWFYDGRIVAGSVLVICGLLEMAVSITQAVFCGKAIKACTSHSQMIITPRQPEQQLYVCAQGRMVPVRIDYPAATVVTMSSPGSNMPPQEPAENRSMPPPYHDTPVWTSTSTN